MNDTLKPYHWGKADARFFVAQDDAENRGWGVFEMGADVPILFWCASKTDAETAALRLNHINEQFLTCRRSQLDPKPLDTGGVEVGGAVVLEGAVNFEYNCAFIDGTELPLREGESYRITIEPLTEKPTDSMGGETDSITVSPYMPKPGEEAKGLDKDYAVADAPGDVTESVASDGWRSIDSAPKDGTEILAYNDADEYGIAEWSPEDDGWQFASSEGVEYEGVTLVAWKPLDPPTVGEKEAATEANSVTPQGAQATPNPIPAADSFGACPDCTNNHHTYEPCPQPEKREGPISVTIPSPLSIEDDRYVDYLDGEQWRVLDLATNQFVGPLCTDESAAIFHRENFNKTEHERLDAAYLAGQKSQPEGDERLVKAAQEGVACWERYEEDEHNEDPDAGTNWHNAMVEIRSALDATDEAQFFRGTSQLPPSKGDERLRLAAKIHALDDELSHTQVGDANFRRRALEAAAGDR